MRFALRLLICSIVGVVVPSLLWLVCVFLALAYEQHGVPAGALPFGSFLVIAVLVVATAHVVVLGLPAFLWLRHRGRLRGATMTAAGFVMGCLPTLLLGLWAGFDSYGGGYSHSEGGGVTVVTKVDGMLTLAGWLELLQSTIPMGLLGAAGAWAFWIAWRRGEPTNLSAATRGPGAGSTRAA